jgi:hypothetical protein
MNQGWFVRSSSSVMVLKSVLVLPTTVFSSGWQLACAEQHGSRQPVNHNEYVMECKWLVAELVVISILSCAVDVAPLGWWLLRLTRTLQAVSSKSKQEYRDHLEHQIAE